MFLIEDKLLSSSEDVLDGIHDSEVAALMPETVRGPSIFIHADFFHLLFDLIKWCSNPFQHNIQPILDKLTSLDSCDEITFQGQLPLSSDFVFPIPLPIDWIAVVSVPKHKHLRLGTVSIPDEMLRKLCDSGYPIK
jgi:hypothetical protein